MATITWINEKLVKHGWSQSELARQAGLSTANVSSVLSGYHTPGIEFYRGVARAFALSLDEVVRRSEGE